MSTIIYLKQGNVEAVKEHYEIVRRNWIMAIEKQQDSQIREYTVGRNNMRWAIDLMEISAIQEKEDIK